MIHQIAHSQNRLGLACRRLRFRGFSAASWILPTLALGVLFAAAPKASAQAPGSELVQTLGVSPALLRNVGLDQKLGDSIPLNLMFRDEQGQPVSLRQFFGHGPVILTLVYYQCPMLCTQVLDSLVHTMRAMKLNLGADYSVLTVSIDPRDTPALAAAKRASYLASYGHPGAGGWHFLTGEAPQIHQLAQAVGFRYAYDASSGQFAHPSGIMVLTSGGKLARYFYGISYPERDLRLGLVEASSDKIGSPTDQILLLCFHYDASTGRYDFLVQRVMKVAGGVTVLGLVMLIALLLRRENYGMPRGSA